MRIERPNLGCVPDPLARAAAARGVLAEVPLSDRSRGDNDRRVDSSSRRILERRERLNRNHTISREFVNHPWAMADGRLAQIAKNCSAPNSRATAPAEI